MQWTGQETDEILVRAAQAGDHSAWSVLCQRHIPRLSAYLGARLRRPAVVDRLVAEVVVGAWKHLSELHNPTHFPAWLRKVGGNVALQWGRRHAQEPMAESFPADRCHGDKELLKRMQTVEAALDRLNDQQRMAVEQRFRGGMDSASLQEALHISAAEVDRLLAESLAILDLTVGPESP